jgi:hypothetical protein
MTWKSILDEDDLSSSTPTAISGAAGAAGAATTVSRSDHVHAFTPASDLSMAGFKLTNVGTPTSAADATTKAYVDALAGGFDYKESVRLATAAAPAAYTRTSNVITFDANGSQSVDGTATVLNDRILLKNGAAGADNGIYYVSTKGTGGAAEVWTRSTDADSSAEVTAGLSVFVSEGTTNGNTVWAITTDDAITLNTTSITFTMVGAPNTVQAGAGLVANGNALDVNVDNATIEISSDAIRVMDGSITNAKLATDAVTNVKVAAAAAIIATKLDFATVPAAFHTRVQENRLDQMAIPTAAVNFNVQEVQGIRIEDFTTGARPAAAANGRFIWNTTVGRLQIDR